jgi:phosphatidylinositol-3-phosphatase
VGLTDRCEACGAEISRAQSYCVECGARVTGRAPLLLALMRRQRRARGSAAKSPPPRAQAGALAAPERRSRGAALVARLDRVSIPARGTSALLVLGFLGFGILVGEVQGTRSGYALSASSRRAIRVVVPATGTRATADGSGAASTAEPPPAAREPTPEAASSAEGEGAGGGSDTNSPKHGSGSSKKASGTRGSGRAASGLAAVKHVFVIMLSDEPYASLFGPFSTAPYLARTLERRGALLVRYHGVATGPLANGIALLSGQGPTAQTAAGCPAFTDLATASSGADEQVLGDGCVYPSATKTLPAQLARKRLKARAYVEGIDEPGASAGACAHPALGQADPTAQGGSAQRYATARDPFVYFHSLIDAADCAGAVVGLRSLVHDLGALARTPALSYIVPDRCHDASPAPCAPGAGAGPAAADTWLKRVVPEVLSSPAYRKNGLLLITADGAPSTGEAADTSSCCGQPRFPNIPAPSGRSALLAPEGGGQVGALLLSPFVKGGTVSQEPYNHFSALRTIEDIFGLEHLGYAALPKVSAFEAGLFAARS